MRILSVVWFKVLPAKYGGQKGTALFNKYLGQHADLTCLCSRNNETTEKLSYTLRPELPVSKLQFINPFTWIKIIRTAKEVKADIIILEYPYHAIAGVLVKWLYKTKLVIHQHNIEYLRFRKQNKWWWDILLLYEKWACRNADLLILKTKEDENTLINKFNIAPSKSIIIPYSIEKENAVERNSIEIKSSGLKDQKQLMFSGTLDYLPNAKAVEAIYNHIAPLLRDLDFPFRITITGRNQHKDFSFLKYLKDNSITQVGEVDSIDTLYQSSDVFINPVLQANGIQTKILDALAAGLNVVAFKSTMKGIEPIPGKTFIVEDGNWTEFVINIVLAAKERQPTPASFYQKYSWELRVEELYQKLQTL